MTESNQGGDSPIRGWIGSLLMVFGLLWCLLAGGCTLVFLVAGALTITQNHEAPDAGIISGALLTGVIGFLPGLFLFLVGRKMKRRGRTPLPERDSGV